MQITQPIISTTTTDTTNSNDNNNSKNNDYTNPKVPILLRVGIGGAILFD